jgi:hypothetical protein
VTVFEVFFFDFVVTTTFTEQVPLLIVLTEVPTTLQTFFCFDGTDKETLEPFGTTRPADFVSLELVMVRLYLVTILLTPTPDSIFGELRTTCPNRAAHVWVIGPIVMSEEVTA